MLIDNKPMKKFYAVLILSVLLACVPKTLNKPVEPHLTKADPIAKNIDSQDLRIKYANMLQAMREELQRGMSLNLPGYPKPYFVSYLTKNTENISVSASNGAIFWDNNIPQRTIYAEVRVGDYNFDSSVSKGEVINFPQNEFVNFFAPLDDSLYAMRRKLWLLTDLEYKEAVAAYLNKKANRVYKIEKDEVPSFSREKPAVFSGRAAELNINPDFLREKSRQLSSFFNKYNEIIESEVRLDFRKKASLYINSEGALILTENAVLTIYINAETKAKDGMPLSNFRVYSIADIKNLPSDEQLYKDMEGLINELLALREAKEMEPYTGPAILSAEVAGVFFHEVLGHRLEGERQDDEQEGMTFSKKVGTRILPEFFTVIDDPTLVESGGITLTGFYEYDDEGVKSLPVTLVEQGVLKNFLMSRTPTKGFLNSNGHGRAESIQKPMGRMGNFIIRSTNEKTMNELTDMLIEECKKQNKPYGFIIERARSGETNTSRFGFQAFKGVPLLVYKIFTEDRHKELVRGVDIVGTPLTVLNKIVATGSDYTTFNGYCGAESGFIPVSVISPEILVKEIELQRTSAQKSRLPILPPP